MNYRPLAKGSEHGLGENLRMARLGFAWARELGAWLRVSDRPDGFYCDLSGDGDLARGWHKTPDGHHRCWWEHNDGVREDLMALLAQTIAGGTRPKRFKGFRRLAFTDAGELIR